MFDYISINIYYASGYTDLKIYMDGNYVGTHSVS